MERRSSDNLGTFLLGFALGALSSWWYQTRFLILGGSSDSKADECKLDNDKTVPSESFSVVSPTSIYSSYAKLSSLGSNLTLGPQTTLNEKEKQNLMEDMSYLVSLPFSQACRMTSAKGYALRVLEAYCGTEQKFFTSGLKHAEIGFHLEDALYNQETQKPSSSATVRALAGVGPVHPGLA